MSIIFENNSWIEIEDYIKRNALILLPIGAIEEHGPHLPVSTDMVISRKIAEAVAQKLKSAIPVLVTPDMWQAYNGRIVKQWPGSLTISQDTQKKLLYEITENIINMGFKKIIYINGHGQNLFTIEAVAREIADNYDVYVTAVFEYKILADFMEKERKSEVGGICHASELETSLMLYLTDLVDMSKAKKNLLTYKSRFRNNDGMKSSKVFWSTWGIEKTESGVLGDPTVASKGMGEKSFKYAVKEICEFAKEYYEFENN